MNNSFMEYMEYLYVNGLTLDEFGNEVPINEEKPLTLSLNKKEDDEDE